MAGIAPYGAESDVCPTISCRRRRLYVRNPRYFNLGAEFIDMSSKGIESKAISVTPRVARWADVARLVSQVTSAMSPAYPLLRSDSMNGAKSAAS